MTMFANRRIRAVAATTATFVLLLAAVSAGQEPLDCMKRFRFKDFAIGAWWGAGAEDIDMRLYADAGFNIDMQNARYTPYKDKQLRLAEKLGLYVMLDGVLSWPPGGGEGSTTGWVSLEEVQWLIEHYVDYPNLMGILINDNCSLDERTRGVAHYIAENAPHLMTWVSMNPDPISQAKVTYDLPIITSQNYPFLYNFGGNEADKRIAFCNSLTRDRDHCNRNDMCMWSFVNTAAGGSAEKVEDEPVALSASQTRFQVYASIAYGAQGIPYFHYWHWIAGTSGPTALYAPVKATNWHVRKVIGPKVLGHRAIGSYHSPDETPSVCWAPQEGALIERLDKQTLVGVLVPEAEFKARSNTPDLLMVVDKRTVKWNEKEPKARRIEIRFGPGVSKVTECMPYGKDIEHDLSESRDVELRPIEAGGGRVLEVEVAEHDFGLQAGVDLPKYEIHPLDTMWRFSTDPDDVGVEEQWFAPDHSTASSQIVTSDKSYTMQGASGYTGYVWYCQDVDIPDGAEGDHVYLLFEAVDEQTWVYIGGQPAFEHSTASTGLGPALLWTKPFAFEATDFVKPGETANLAVRVHNCYGTGGIYHGVWLVTSSEPLDNEILTGVVLESAKEEKS